MLISAATRADSRWHSGGFAAGVTRVGTALTDIPLWCTTAQVPLLQPLPAPPYLSWVPSPWSSVLHKDPCETLVLAEVWNVDKSDVCATPHRYFSSDLNQILKPAEEKMQMQHSLGFPKLLSLSLNMKIPHRKKEKASWSPLFNVGKKKKKSIWSFAQNKFKEKIFLHEILIQTFLGEKMAIVLDSNKVNCWSSFPHL